MFYLLILVDGYLKYILFLLLYDGLTCLLVLVINLRGQVVANVANIDVGRLLRVGIVDLVLDHQRHVGRKRKNHLAAEGGSLGEVIQILERKRLRDRLLHRDGDVLLRLVDVRRLLQGDRASAKITFGRELDARLGARDGDRVTQLSEIAANLRKLGRRHRDRNIVAGLGDAQVLRVQIHQLDLVLRYLARVALLCKKSI